MNKKEFWRVEIHSRKYFSEQYVFHVFATSAASAEKRALKVARQEKIEKPFCYSASFKGYIQ